MLRTYLCVGVYVCIVCMCYACAHMNVIVLCFFTVQVFAIIGNSSGFQALDKKMKEFRIVRV